MARSWGDDEHTPWAGLSNGSLPWRDFQAELENQTCLAVRLSNLERNQQNERTCFPNSQCHENNTINTLPSARLTAFDSLNLPFSVLGTVLKNILPNWKRIHIELNWGWIGVLLAKTPLKPPLDYHQLMTLMMAIRILFWAWLLACLLASLYACLTALKPFSFAKQLSKTIIFYITQTSACSRSHRSWGNQRIISLLWLAGLVVSMNTRMRRHSLHLFSVSAFLMLQKWNMLCLSWWRQGGPRNPFVSFSQSLWHFERGSRRLATIRIWQPQSLNIVAISQEPLCFLLKCFVFTPQLHSHPCTSIVFDYWSWVTCANKLEEKRTKSRTHTLQNNVVRA